MENNTSYVDMALPTMTRKDGKNAKKNVEIAGSFDFKQDAVRVMRKLGVEENFITRCGEAILIREASSKEITETDADKLVLHLEGDGDGKVPFFIHRKKNGKDF